MKYKNLFSWKRLWRTSLALLLVFSMLLCGCANTGDGDGDTKPPKNNSLLGDGDGRLEAQDAVDSITNIYGALLGAVGGNQEPDSKVEMELVLTPGEELKVQLGNALSQLELDSDMSWLKNIGVHMEMGYADDLIEMVVGAKINGKDVATSEMVMDMLGGMMYLSVPDLQKQAIGTEVDMNQMQVMIPDMSEMMAEYSEFVKDLPSDQELNAVLTYYLNVALEELDTPTTSSTELSHNGVTQKVTSTTYFVTRHDVLDIASTLLTTAKTDGELEKVLDAFSKVTNSIGAKQAAEEGTSWTDVDLHAQLMEAIDPALEDIADTKANTEDLEFLEFVAYGDGKTQQGFKLRIENTDYLTMYSLQSGDNTAFLLRVPGFEISGNGTAKGSKSSGDYVVSMNGQALAYVGVKDFDTKALNKGELKGTVRLQLSEALVDAMGKNMFLNEDTVIELVLDIDGKTSKMDINIYLENILLFGIGLTTKTGSAGKITVPSSYVDMQDPNAMEQWAQGVKFDSVLRNLRSAGVPDKLVDMLQQALDEAMSGG